jgi:adenylylsulfate kinase-like enzyme
MVVILCGTQRTGKSTTARKLADKLKKQGNVKILVKEKPGKVYNGFDEIHVVHRYQQFPKLLEENLNKTDYIIIDATFFRKKWREMVEGIIGKENIFIIYLYCSLKTSLERDRQMESPVGEKGIRSIATEMEKPENPDVSINTDKFSPEQTVSEILNKIIQN